MQIVTDLKKFITEGDSKNKRAVVTYIIYYIVITSLVFFAIRFITNRRTYREKIINQKKNYYHSEPMKLKRDNKFHRTSNLRVKTKQEPVRETKNIPPRFKISQVLT